uniref:Uncharacterized protein n=1 Tax=Candidatus Kentrum sp. DK TaxID=2126562 RepID=A0A450TN67_9GAMM|nr:MAG: hypothetical protein BECKDK2373C_GA0170839_12093 [Candidatus Kentron sp. DK]
MVTWGVGDVVRGVYIAKRLPMNFREIENDEVMVMNMDKGISIASAAFVSLMLYGQPSYAGTFANFFKILDGNIIEGQATVGINKPGAIAKLRAENSGTASGKGSTVQNASGISVTQQAGSSRMKGAFTGGINEGNLTATAINSGNARNGGTVQNCAAVSCGQAGSN